VPLFVITVESKKGRNTVIMVEQEREQDLAGFFSKRYKKLVWSFRARYADLSEMEVEDIVSDLMTDLFNRVDITEQVENIGAYIYRSIQNKVIDYLRRRKKTVSLDDTVSNSDDGDQRNVVPEPSYDMQVEVDASEIRQRLAKALDSLEPNQRAIWVATELDGYTFRELAEEWDLPMGTLLARKHRAVAALQKELQDLKNR
jgi:RNA polymerase sigma factor (sigma-70 family)